MSYSDEVRAYVFRKIIEPARSRGDRRVRVRAGDVHEALGYRKRYPLVCSALGTAVFEREYRVRRVAVEGPLNGSNTLMTFEILP